MKELNVLDTKITYFNINDEDYISLTDMLNGVQESMNNKEIDIYEIANFIIRGGWPANISVDNSQTIIYEELKKLIG